MLDPDDYTVGRRLGRHLREANAWGIAYDSVRRQGGECAAVFRPPALSNCRQGAHLGLFWDGSRIAYSYHKSQLRPRD